MAHVKPSVRSRAANPSQQLVNGVGVGGGAVAVEELAVFEKESFNADSYVQSKCQSMSEKALRKLCSELLELKKASAEEMRKSVYANYAAFIRTSREISDLESELLAMRNLLSTQATLLHGLAEGVEFSNLTGDGSMHLEENGYLGDGALTSAAEKRAQALLDMLDVCLCEKKVEEALAALDEGDKLISDGRNGLSSTAVKTSQAALAKRRARLAEQLAKAAEQPSIRGTELRSAISALDRLGDGSRAHTLMLNSHHERLKYEIRDLRPSSTSYGGAYTTSLSQLVFSSIAQAAKDSVIVFGEQPAYASELFVWASGETEQFAFLLKKHVLSSSAAIGGLRAAAECAQIAIGHCALLESQGLALCPILSKLVKPSIEQAFKANVKRIEESVTALAAADDWVLKYTPATRSSTRTSLSTGAGLSSHLKLTISALSFNSMIQDFVDDVAPLVSLQLGGMTLDALGQLFEVYINILLKAMPMPIEDETSLEIFVRVAETEAQQLAVLANAAALADELLPRASLKLVPLQHNISKDDLRTVSQRNADKLMARVSRLPEQRDWRRRLQRGVDKLRDHFCQQHALGLIYTEDGEPQLCTEIYLKLDNQGDESYWQQEAMPSPIFQALFEKLSTIAEIAAEVLTGRERVVTLLLMRLTETVIIFLSNDQEFWEEMENGPRPIGANGLQQFVLDMQFVIQVASQGRYSSRNMRQVISDIISRAISSFSASGIDPNSVLPEDEWFLATAQDALKKLVVGWSKSGANDREPNSPTASTHSSLRSHGSP
ncbi:hypothetical protein O6H91_09G002400 [Diphasiastrum complanatum]|uniref:Uncharacterized protein n=3 Tax=Diphasiastrum complanatum TaxID=34168 RepID=A0ACC2CL49_DIPCM|nr:hypothetical protein O6H91_09G002400 [Diphasiastrum complanatum]KAJ7542603.1 hypothetical protein O6H91_09G002400 [Diphasiastrum complanatum]KAJ7542604.1 hypothetical protein O6H91_09G002400 [Diphasiastrum complanatum]